MPLRLTSTCPVPPPLVRCGTLRALVVFLFGALIVHGCSPAESRNAVADTDEGNENEEPGFTLVAETDADTAFTYAVDAGDSLVVFGRGNQVVVANVVDPAHPRVLGSVALTGHVRDVVLRGRHAFAAADSGGLHIIDLSNPAALKTVGRMRFADRAYGVDAANGRAYVAARSEGLRILDVSDPSSPAEIGHVSTPDEAVDVVVRGDFAYVAAWYASMRVIDVGDPGAAEEVSFASFDSYDNGAARSVQLDGNIGVQAIPDMGLRIIDVSDPRDVKLYKVYRGLFAPADAAVRGSTAFVADQSEGLRVLDLADPVMPVEIGAVDISGSAMSVVLSGDVAFVAAREGGLRIVDISRPNDPREIAHLDVTDEVVDVVVFGDTLVAAGRQNGIALHDATNLRRLSGFVAAGSNRVAVHGRMLLIGGAGSVSLFDRYNLDAALAAAPLPGTVQGIAATDDVVIAAVERFGLRLLAPGSLREVGSFEPDRAQLASSNQTHILRTPVAAWDVLVDSLRAFAAFDDGIRVVDVSTPARPTLTGFLPTPQRVYRLLRMASLLFAACDDGLRVIDVSNPSQPTQRAYLKTPSFATALALRGEHIYVGDLSGVITVATVSRPQTRIYQVKVADRILGLAALEKGLAVAAGSQGVRIVSDIPPSSP